MSDEEEDIPLAESTDEGDISESDHEMVLEDDRDEDALKMKGRIRLLQKKKEFKRLKDLHRGKRTCAPASTPSDE